MDHPFRSGGYLGLRSTEHRHPPPRLYRDPLLEKLSKINYVPGKILKVLGRRRKTCMMMTVALFKILRHGTKGLYCLTWTIGALIKFDMFLM